jgi:hypothetical protein
MLLKMIIIINIIRVKEFLFVQMIEYIKGEKKRENMESSIYSIAII